MLDTFIRPYIDPPLARVARALAATPLTPNMVTVIGFGFGLMACVAVALQYSIVAFSLIVINRLFDGLDGALARAKGMNSDFGGYLDFVFDYMIYAGIPFFAALGLMDMSAFFAATFVIFSFIGSGVSFLSYAIMAAKRGMETAHQGRKSFYFASGFMEGFETVLFMMLVCLFPQGFEAFCIIFGILCWITTIARIHMASKVFV